MRLDMFRAAINYPVPLSRTASLLIAAFIVVGLSLLQGYPVIPPPGLAIALLGAGAVIVAVRTDHLTSLEKVGWVCVAFLLFTVEMKAIYHDRDEHDKEVQVAQERGERNFRKIAEGIAQTIQQSQQNFSTEMDRTNTLLASTLGGDSFCLMMFEPGALMWKNPAAPLFQAVPLFSSKGRYPLYGVNALITDERAFRQLMGKPEKGKGLILTAALPAQSNIAVGDMPVNSSRFMFDRAIPLRDHAGLFWHILYMARNGEWHEDLRLSFASGKWVQAVRVYRMEGKTKVRNLYVSIDPDYPRNQSGQIDWKAD